MRRKTSMMTAALVVYCGVMASAQEGSRETRRELDTALETWVAAFNKHDAKALANEYAEDSEIMLPNGEKIRGRAAIERTYTELFAKSPELKCRIADVSRRFLTPEIVVEDGTWEESGNTDPNEPTKGLYSDIIVKRDGRWLVDVGRSWVPTKAPQEPD